MSSSHRGHPHKKSSHPKRSSEFKGREERPEEMDEEIDDEMDEDELEEETEDEEEESSSSSSSSSASGRAGDLMRKMLTAGVGAIFLTEESVRGLVSELKLPKELLGGVLDSAQKGKTEFLQNLSKDLITKVGEKIDPVGLLQEFLSKNEVEFTIRVSVKPKDKKN